MSAQVNECKGNMKKLYNFFNLVTGKKVQNPMPERQNDEDLAEEFAEFFHNKITIIRDSPEHVPRYSPVKLSTSEFREFTSLSPNNVEKS